MGHLNGTFQWVLGYCHPIPHTQEDAPSLGSPEQYSPAFAEVNEPICDVRPATRGPSLYWISPEAHSAGGGEFTFLQERKLRLRTDLGCGHMTPRHHRAHWHLTVVLITTWAAASIARR